MWLSGTNNLEICTWSQNKSVHPNTHKTFTVYMYLEVIQRLGHLFSSLTSDLYSAMAGVQNMPTVCVTASSERKGGEKNLNRMYHEIDYFPRINIFFLFYQQFT